jgi:hypothetical protein
MGEARRRKLAGTYPETERVEAKPTSFNEAISAFADHVLHGTGDAPTIAIGPIV